MTVGLVLACSIVIAGNQAFGQSDLASFNFKQVVTDNEGNKYIIGEVQNNDPGSNMLAEVYLGKSDLQSAYYSQMIGVIGHGMAMPFKIDLSSLKPGADIDDLKIFPYLTRTLPPDSIRVDYATLHMQSKTHAMSGMVKNDLPFDIENIRIYAIAENSHAKVLDVTQSPVIKRINTNGSAGFTLMPLDSIASQVAYYSCFVAGQVEQNYTFTDESGKKVLFELGGDGVFKNISYDTSDHSIHFNARGVFPTGGYAELMIFSGPSAFENAALTATVNGTSYPTVISSQEMVAGNAYKHLSILYPLGLNYISVQPVAQTPEYQYSYLVMLAAMTCSIFLRRLVLSTLNS